MRVRTLLFVSVLIFAPSACWQLEAQSPTVQSDADLFTKRQAIALPISQGGVFDPSLADTGPNGRAWMSYTAVNPSPRWGAQNSRTETTRLAYSDDHGRQWRDAGLQLNQIKDVEFDRRRGTWVNEVSSLVYDPLAAPSDRWQLYWHQYLSVSDKGEFSHSWIAYKGAETPEGLAAAPTVKLFAGRIYEPMSGDGEALSPIPGQPRIAINKLAEETEYCLAPTEPGGMANRSGVYMSLQCVEPPFRGIAGILATMTVGPKFSIVLLKCDAPCRPSDPKSWRYIGKALAPDDATNFSARGFVAPDLYTSGKQTNLIVSPMVNKPIDDAYDGCLVFTFANLEQARLVRNGAGGPIALRRINGKPGTFNGACTYRPSVPESGFIYGEILLKDSGPLFQMFQTGPLP